MVCIFCKSSDCTFNSVEHIIPESLGNRSHILRPGIVCDRCNNYFGSKVEGPLLAAEPFRSLRFMQSLENKRGRVPEVSALVSPGVEVKLSRVGRKPDGILMVEAPPDEAESILTQRNGILLLGGGRSASDLLLSRFMAKCALEALALRVHDRPDLLLELATEPQFDMLRDHARVGSTPNWPVHERTIYDADRHITIEGTSVQTVFEFDLLLTAPDNIGTDGTVRSEMYFVLAIFGREFCINMGGPEIDGYNKWLTDHGDVSPLYWGKNGTNR